VDSRRGAWCGVGGVDGNDHPRYVAPTRRPALRRAIDRGTGRRGGWQSRGVLDGRGVRASHAMVLGRSLERIREGRARALGSGRLTMQVSRHTWCRGILSLRRRHTIVDPDRVDWRADAAERTFAGARASCTARVRSRAQQLRVGDPSCRRPRAGRSRGADRRAARQRRSSNRSLRRRHQRPPIRGRAIQGRRDSRVASAQRNSTSSLLWCATAVASSRAPSCCEKCGDIPRVRRAARSKRISLRSANDLATTHNRRATSSPCVGPVIG
jgi:hypothetical protein